MLFICNVFLVRKIVWEHCTSILKITSGLSWPRKKLSHNNCLQFPLYRQINARLRVVPHFSSGIVERAKRERAWKSPHARKGDTWRGERMDVLNWFGRGYELHTPKSVGREGSKAWALSVVPHFSLSPPRVALSRVGWFSRALAIRSLYYPWGKMGDYS